MAYTFGEVKNNVKQKKSSFNGREFVAKLSKGVMFPIAILPIAGLFLGLGSTLLNISDASKGEYMVVNFVHIVGSIIQVPGNVIFALLPLFFCIAIAIAFTGDSGPAALCSVVGYAVFLAIQQALIVKHGDVEQGFTYNFLWETFDQTKFDSLFSDTIGVKSLSSGVVGGILVGAISAILYNKFRQTQLPSVLGFFSGVRFVPIITFIVMCFVSLIFSMIWMYIGIGLSLLGGVINKFPWGTNALAYGLIKRCLVPLGVHHAFYMPFWQTSVGGEITPNAPFFFWYEGNAYGIVDPSHPTNPLSWKDEFSSYGGSWQGDQNLFFFFVNYVCGNGHQYEFVQFTLSTPITGTADPNTCADWAISEGAKKLSDVMTGFDGHITWNTVCNLGQGSTPLADSTNPGCLNLYPSQYIALGEPPCMNFGLPAAGLAMISCIPKDSEQKQSARSIIVAASLTSLLTGITEPIEFTFLFVAPWLFYGINAPLFGLAAWVMKLLNSHIGVSFSSGLIDNVIYGLVPDINGCFSQSWNIVIVGLAVAPIYFFLFRSLILKFNIQTPGRTDVVKLYTKQDYLDKKQGKLSNGQTVSLAEASNEVPEQYKNDALYIKALGCIEALGGAQNIVNVDACATKLRVQVVDKNLANRDKLMSLGAFGVVYPSPTSVYSVFGAEADLLKQKIQGILWKK